jgi:hypothetical protein
LKKIFCIFLLSLFVNACKKDNSSPKVVNGNISLNVHVVHHSWDINNVKVYIKYNTQTYPGPDSTLYDKYQITDGYGKTTFEQLYPGNYYIYAYGWDAVWGANVIGYKQVGITTENVVNNELSVTLYVSE